MSRLIRTSITSAASNSCNSLEGIESYANLDTVLVQETNHWYRFFSASTATPNGTTIIAPANVTPPAAGRWIRQGAPALGGDRSQHPVLFPDLCAMGFGEGAILRMADAHLASASGVVISTGAPTAVGATIASLANPSPTKRYWAKAIFSLGATGGAAAIANLFPSFSYDQGGLWNPVDSSLISVVSMDVANQGVVAIAISALTLGSALPGAGVTEGDAELQFRIEANMDTGNASTNGSLTLQLFETS